MDFNDISDSVGSLAGAGTADLGTATLTSGSNDTSTTFSGSITGTGSLTKNGAGTMTMTGDSDFSGTTTVSAGKLLLNNSSGLALSGTANVTVSAGAELELGADNQIVTTADLSLAGGTIFLGGNDQTLDDFAQSGNSVTDFGDGSSIFTFSDVSTATGNLDVVAWTGTPGQSGGTDQFKFNVGNADASLITLRDLTTFSDLGSGATIVSVSGNVSELVPDFSSFSFFTWNVTGSGNWEADANWTPDPPGSGIGPSNPDVKVLLGNSITGDATVDLNSNMTVGTMIIHSQSASNDYTIDGNQTLTFDITGNTVGGKANLTVLTGSPTITGNVSIDMADDLRINQNNSSGTFTVNADIDTMGNDLTVRGLGDTDIGGVISGASGTLTKGGSGILTLSANNTYTGVTSINKGTVEITNQGKRIPGSN